MARQPKIAGAADWARVAKVMDSLSSNTADLKNFTHDPSKFIVDKKIDLVLPNNEKLSDVVVGMSAAEIRATLDSIGSMSDRITAGRVAIATPVANANAGANANALANANANANANTNTNGFAATDQLGVRPDLVRITEDVMEQPFLDAASDMRLNMTRIQALLKRSLTDSDAVTVVRNTPAGELRVARSTFRGMTFEVEALMSAEDIKVLGVKKLV